MSSDADELLAATSVVPVFSLARQQVLAKCVSVYDGDTAHFVFRPFPNCELAQFSCRMLGYNSAEMKTKDSEEKAHALDAKAALAGLILDKIVMLDIGDFDFYGRPLVTVHTECAQLGSTTVNHWMVESGHGMPYNGRGEKKWK